MLVLLIGEVEEAEEESFCTLRFVAGCNGQPAAPRDASLGRCSFCERW